jgi:hypothetical protein
MTERITIALLFFLITFISCERKQHTEYRTHSVYNKIDSLRSNYLNIHDSLILYWNRSISENKKHINLLQKLEEKMEEIGQADDGKLKELKLKLEELKKIDFNIETINNKQLLKEYNQLSTEIKDELFVLAKEIKTDETVEKLIQALQQAELRARESKEKYNKMADGFNKFIDKYWASIKDITYQDSISKRPLFESTN